MTGEPRGDFLDRVQFNQTNLPKSKAIVSHACVIRAVWKKGQKISAVAGWVNKYTCLLP